MQSGGFSGIIIIIICRHHLHHQHLVMSHMSTTATQAAVLQEKRTMIDKRRRWTSSCNTDLTIQHMRNLLEGAVSYTLGNRCIACRIWNRLDCSNGVFGCRSAFNRLCKWIERWNTYWLFSSCQLGCFRLGIQIMEVFWISGGIIIMLLVPCVGVENVTRIRTRIEAA